MKRSNSKIDWIIYNLILGSIFTWSYSMIKSSPDMGNFGLIQSLSFVYFVSMALLLGSFILALTKSQNKKIYFVIILVLIVMLFLTPAIIEGTPRFRFSYKTYGYAEFINRNGYLDPNIIWYHSWPGSFLSTSMLSNIFRQEDDFLFLMYFPFIIQIIYFFPLYIFLKSLFQDDKKIWISIWIFYIINFINQEYMSPQAFAYLFYLILLSIIVKLTKIKIFNGKNYNYNIQNKFISIILISGLTITHMMTPLIILSMILSSALFNSTSVQKKNLFNFAFISSVIMAAWVIYGAYVYFNWHLLDFFENTINANMYSQNVQQRISGSPAHLIISELMAGTTLISGLFAVIGIFLSFYRRDDLFKTNIRLFYMIAAILVLSNSPYGGEMIMRIFLFMLPFISFFIAQIFIQKAKIILIIFLIIMTPLNLVTHFGNEKYDHVSKAELNSFNFYYKYIGSKNVIGGYPITYYKFAEKFDYVQFKEFKDLVWDGSRYISKNSKYKNNIIISKGDIEQLEIFSNDDKSIKITEKNVSSSNQYQKIYANGDTNLYNII